jgi:hypothetical protein
MNISDINAYFINPDDYSHRRKPTEDTLISCNFKSITRISFNEKFHGKNNTMTKAHLALLNKVLEDDAFPFVLFEDDARLIKHLPESFDIPDEAELIYLGGSTYCFGARLMIEEYNDEFFRVYNMLSAHAILVPDIRGFNTIVEAYNKALNNSSYNDIYLARESNYHIFLVPKKGNYFYQDDYTSSVTKFLWEDVKDKFLKI